MLVNFLLASSRSAKYFLSVEHLVPEAFHLIHYLIPEVCLAFPSALSQQPLDFRPHSLNRLNRLYIVTVFFILIITLILLATIGSESFAPVFVVFFCFSILEPFPCRLRYFRRRQDQFSLTSNCEISMLTDVKALT